MTVLFFLPQGGSRCWGSEMHHTREVSLLCLLNDRFSPAVFGREKAFSDCLGLSDEELALAEERGFTPEQIDRLINLVRELGVDLTWRIRDEH